MAETFKVLAWVHGNNRPKPLDETSKEPKQHTELVTALDEVQQYMDSRGFDMISIRRSTNVEALIWEKTRFNKWILIHAGAEIPDSHSNLRDRS